MLASLLVSAPAIADDEGAQLTVVHGIPGVTVDVYVNNVNTLPSFAPETNTDPIPLPAGSYDVDIYLEGEGPAAANSDSTQAHGVPVLSATLALADGDNISAIAHLAENGDLALTAFANDTSDVMDGDARLVVRHTAKAPAVDIIANGSLALFEGVTNPNEAQVDVPADTYGVTINAAGTSTVAFDAGDVTLPEGQSTIVYAIGDLAGGSFGLLIQAIPNLGPAGWFDDDDASVHRDNIDLIASLGITKGTSASTFSPEEDVTRGQMAAFIRRALELPSSATDFFSDDDSSIFEDDINAIAAVGITLGTGADIKKHRPAFRADRFAAFPFFLMEMMGPGVVFTRAVALQA